MTLLKNKKNTIINEFALHANDKGSTEVQIALLTHDIVRLTEHCKKNPKDYSSRRGLLYLVGRRITFLQYLKRKNENKYKEIINKLGLRK